MNKKLSALLTVSALALLLTATPVMADTTVEDDSMIENVGAGADVTHTSNHTVVETTNDSVNATADTETDIEVEADVEQKDNVGDGEVDLDPVKMDVEWTNTVGAAAAALSSGDVDVDTSKTADTIGANANVDDTTNFTLVDTLNASLNASLLGELELEVQQWVDQKRNVGDQSVEGDEISLMADIMNTVGDDDDLAAASMGSVDYEADSNVETVGAGADVTHTDNVNIVRTHNKSTNVTFDTEVDFEVERDVEQKDNVGDQTIDLDKVKLDVDVANSVGGSSSSAEAAGDVDVKTSKTSDTIGADANVDSTTNFTLVDTHNETRNVTANTNVWVDITDEVEQEDNVGDSSVTVGGFDGSVKVENSL
jgi:hypothetical protein